MNRTLTLAFRVLIITAVLAVWATAGSGVGAGIVASQTPGQPKPSPTPRRKLTKPVDGPRGFEMYAGRDASARLIAASSTRNVNDQAAPDYNRGQKNYEAGRFAQAVKDFAQAVKLDPQSPEAHYALARALTKTAKTAAAIDTFKQLLNLNPADELKIWSYYLMGGAYSDLGQYKEAIENYREAIKLKPDLSKPYYNLGLAYVASNRVADAVAEFQQAVQLKPDYAEAHYNLGVAYLQMGKRPEADAQQRILAKLNPGLARQLDSFLKK
jgi:tetratricopeptide (TPR) repeat protein